MQTHTTEIDRLWFETIPIAPTACAARRWANW